MSDVRCFDYLYVEPKILYQLCVYILYNADLITDV